MSNLRGNCFLSTSNFLQDVPAFRPAVSPRTRASLSDSPAENLTDIPLARATGCDPPPRSFFLFAQLPWSLFKGCARGVLLYALKFVAVVVVATRAEFVVSKKLTYQRVCCIIELFVVPVALKSLLFRGCYIRFVISKSLLYQSLIYQICYFKGLDISSL